MPFFQYKAVTPAGEVQEGVLEASSTPAAVARLQEMGFIPIRAVEGGIAKTAAPSGAPLFRRNTITQNDIGRLKSPGQKNAGQKDEYRLTAKDTKRPVRPSAGTKNGREILQIDTDLEEKGWPQRAQRSPRENGETLTATRTLQ